MAAVNEVKSELSAVRSESEVDALLEDVTQCQESWDLDPLQVPRQRRPPARFTGSARSAVAVSVADHYRPMYFSLLDIAVLHLSERFSDSPGCRNTNNLNRF